MYRYNLTKQQIARQGGINQDQEEDLNVIMRLRKWEKFAEFPSMIPDQIVWKFESESQGAFKMAFSHNGKYLAASCTLKSGKTVVKIFDVEDGNLQLILRGHNDLIHDIDWSYDDRFLITASADGACRLWNLSEKESDNSDRFNYQDNDRLFFMTELYHTSFVYSAKIHPAHDDSVLYIATICFDGKVRVWSVNIDDIENPWYKLEHEMSINDKAQFTLGTKKTIYELEDNLEDETLRLIMNPQETPDDIANAMTHSKSTQANEKFNTGYKNLIENKHPNAMVFDYDGRLFVADSHGQINVWRIAIQFSGV